MIDALVVLAVANDALADGDTDRAMLLRNSVDVDFDWLGRSKWSPRPPWRRDRTGWIDRRGWLLSPYSHIDMMCVVPRSRFLGAWLKERGAGYAATLLSGSPTY